MALKNRTSEGRNTFDKIQKILAENGAKKVMFDYSNDGKLEAISFAMDIGGNMVGFKLPALMENVIEIMYGGVDRWNRKKKITLAQREQGYKTAWANIRDWIDAQIALVQTQQVQMVQVFLPYMVDQNDKTLYERVVENPGFLLGDGK